LGEAGFSMVRLKEIAKQREIFSSVESLSNESSESDVSFIYSYHYCQAI